MQMELDIDERYGVVVKRFRRCGQHWMLTKPLSRWVKPGDRYFPSILINKTLGEVVETGIGELRNVRGIGRKKLRTLMDVIERAVEDIELCIQNEMLVSSQSPEELGQQRSDPVKTWPHHLNLNLSTIAEFDAVDRAAADNTYLELSCDEWTAICHAIKQAGFETYTFGRLVRSHRKFVARYLNKSVATVTDLSFEEFMEFKRTKPTLAKKSFGEIFRLARIGAIGEREPTFSFHLTAGPIGRVAKWVEHVLGGSDVPEYRSIGNHLLFPLIEQVKIDLGTRTVKMLKRRIGYLRKPETLNQIAAPLELTRERVRQILMTVRRSIHLRWPDGKLAVQRIYQKCIDTQQPARSSRLVRRIMSLIFDEGSSFASTVGQIHNAWKNYAIQKQTPILKSELMSWVSRQLPRLAPEAAVKLLEAEMLSLTMEGKRWYFSKEPLDRLLYFVCETKQPVPLTKLSERVGLDQDVLRGLLIRDRRFAEHKQLQFGSVFDCGLLRFERRWYFRLFALSPGEEPSRKIVPADGVLTAAWAWLRRESIVDLSAWGLHRLVNELIAQLYQGKLSDRLSPFVLAELAVRESRRQVRHMRRHRIFWKDAIQIPGRIRGKNGWASHVLQEFGMPLEVQEIAPLLRAYYQDYPRYVISQLSFCSKGDDRKIYPVEKIVFHHRVLLIPDGWQPNSNVDNVSDGIKKMVSGAVKRVSRRRAKLSEYESLPWFAEMMKRHPAITSDSQ
ncbi:MAG: hypothetical protein Q8M16_23955 [Pirellulaceae bacterium]|nr:hypothetical protein [Pirellulaceae bacterium]